MVIICHDTNIVVVPFPNSIYLESGILYIIVHRAIPSDLTQY